MNKNIVKKIDDKVKINNILVSVSDKSGLNIFIPELVKLNSKLIILSTGGTYTHIKQILGKKSKTMLKKVSDYTKQPETQGGLVKTLDFKIYLGILTETYNANHQEDLKRTNAKIIDMVVANLYPFKETIEKQKGDLACEHARGNIDIGGPSMIRAAAKNFIRTASVVDPLSYPFIVQKLKKNKGALLLEDRFLLAAKAFKHTADYDKTIADYLNTRDINEVKACY